MPAMTELERGALEAWTPAQQAALNHSHMAEQLKRDEERAAKEDAEKKKKLEKEIPKGKKKDDGDIKIETITTEAVLGDLIKAHVPALFAFLDIFGPVQYSLPALFAVHIGAWRYITPDHLSHLLPLFLTHLLPIFMAWRSLFYPSSHLERDNDAAKAKWQKECEALKKSGKDKAEFPDPPAPPPGWQICISDRVSWTSYFLVLGLVEWVEHWAFEGEVLGLMWWPRLKVVMCIGMYWIWEKDDKGRQTMGATKLVAPFLP